MRPPRDDSRSGLPVLWLCGAPGVGKSVIAWALFEALGAEGRTAAYVDIDQLGMLLPATEADPDRHALKTEALVALLPGYADAGADVLVVSGVADPSMPVDALDAAVTFCLLTVDEATLRRRILARGWAEEIADECIEEGMVLREAPFVHVLVDTTALDVAEVVARVRPLVPDGTAKHTGVAPQAPAAVDLVLVTGPRAVGSSTVSFDLARSWWRDDRTTGFVDLQQLAFLRQPGRPGHSQTALGIAQVATLHGLFARHGAELLLVSGHLEAGEPRSLRERVPAAQVTGVRLRADEATLAEHVRERVTGSAARLAGDDLVNASAAHQAHVLRAAVEEQHVLELEAAEDVVVDVTGRNVEDVVASLQQLLDAR
ncbi:MAG: AAA family ATPase [Nocardioidaceae bacterium]